MPAISMLIKPASSLCNLRCGYCFYHDEAVKRASQSYGIMSRETLENIVKKTFETASGSITFAFQGGEPTLAGIDFYLYLFELCGFYNAEKKIAVNYTLQTNGVLPSEDECWAEMFGRHKFLIGLSVDGTKDIHDGARVDADGVGSYKYITGAVRNFKKHGVEFNILTVVNAVTAKNIVKIYKFYKSQGWRHIQFIPCLDPLGEQPFTREKSLTPQRYLFFLKNLFDLWYGDAVNGDYVSVRQFDNLTGMFAGFAPESCGMLGRCAIQFVIEADGGVYPCDFYALDDYLLGNINERDIGFKEISESGRAREFIQSSFARGVNCAACKWRSVCRGGCARYKRNGEYIYCGETREFFDYAGERFIKLSKMIQQR